MSINQGHYLSFVKPDAPSSMIKTLSVTEGILKMEMFGDVYECEFEFEPSQAITSVPEALYCKVKAVMFRLDYEKVRDGVYKGDCNAINQKFDEYLDQYPSHSKTGILIHSDEKDGSVLSHNTFISESDGLCHIHLRNGEKKYILGASFLEKYDVTVDTRNIDRSKPKLRLKIKRYEMDWKAPSQ
ncbi:unnamed protein product [Albugo candida]|nr:unnamed protein product [Albugo candida]|eukprot:CCI48727.1 unnamed protein product [Albugo candida]